MTEIETTKKEVKITVEVISTKTDSQISQNVQQSPKKIANLIKNPFSKVRTKNVLLEGDEAIISPRETYVPSEDISSPLLVPYNFKVVTKTDDSIYMTWQGNGSSYEGIIKSGTFQQTFTIYQNYAMIDGLTENTRYELALRAVNGTEKSAWGTLQFTTEPKIDINQIIDQTDFQPIEQYIGLIPTTEPTLTPEVEVTQGFFHYLTIGNEVIEKYFDEDEIRISVEVAVPIRRTIPIKYSNQDTTNLWTTEIFINGRKVAKKGIISKKGNDVELKCYIGKFFVKPIKSNSMTRTKGVMGIHTTGFLFQKFELKKEEQHLDSAEPIPKDEYASEVYQYTSDVQKRLGQGRYSAENFIEDGVKNAENYINNSEAVPIKEKKKRAFSLFG